MTYVFEAPGSYVQGRDVSAAIGSHAESLGDHALVLGDDVVLSLVADPVEEGFRDRGIETTVEEFGEESSEEEVARIAGIGADAGADIVVGAGGGKALDTAKAVAIENDVAMVSMPTIASTDAPTSALSVIYTPEGEFEEYWFHERHPDLVLVDTALVATAPTRFFTSGIGDALATWFEADAAYRSSAENMVGGRSTRAAHRLGRLCYETLREHAVSAVHAVENDAVTESVEAVTEANTLLSGLGFESGGLAAAHAVHNGLTQLEETHHATHGEKVNVGTLTQLVLEGHDDAFVEELIEFSLAVDLPVTLSGIGIDDPESADLGSVAEAACAGGETIHNEPFEVTPAMVEDALRTADALGRDASEAA